ncbi:ABC transporter ATP-binding protein [Aerococcaceae bacterium zg-ZJ1578]|uniref:ABC transporter ATP-binding protein n=1 Tax=Aerococcaceae bacterium zg-252 TaxID=2796928 RepID=UPI001A2235F7|nr:ABC transporter ATP-binding protein [Aerococcaceae bacterium zg-1578]
MIVEVKDVKKVYGKKEVLKGISFSINEPGIVALVGPNGAGKSTLLNAMVNQLDIDEGTIKLCDKPNTDVKVFNDVSYLRDNSVLYPYLTGMDHLAYAARLYGVNRIRIDEVVEKMEIGSFVNRRVDTYSLGMKQQLLIALAILNHSKLIIMDEPLNGLDPSRILFFRNLVKELTQQGKTILMSSHTLSEIDTVTQHILFLKNGNIIEEHLDELNQTSEERYVELFGV